MDLRLLLTTFVSVFLAEIGDKTQLATLSFAAGARSEARWSVFAGAALALVSTTLVSVLLGGYVAEHVDPRWTRRLSGALFVAIGCWLLVRSR